MTKLIGIILILAALALAYVGITTINESTASVEIIGIELSASDEGQRSTGFIYVGAALVLFIGGVVLAARK